MTARKLLQEKRIAIENDIRGLLPNLGLKVGVVGTMKFEDRTRELVVDMPDLEKIMTPLLVASAKLRAEFVRLHRKVLVTARDDATCKRSMTIRCQCDHRSGFHQHTTDIPARFRKSKAVGRSWS